MRELFKDLLAVDSVRGVLYFTPPGELAFAEFQIGGSDQVDENDWYALVKSLGKTREAELVFEKGRLYIRRTEKGVLIVVMGLIAPSAIIRLNCDILLAALKGQKTARGLKRLFGF